MTGPDRRPQTGDETAARHAGRVRLDDGVVRRRVLGHGPAVLCLHGVSAHGGVWSRVADRLRGTFTLHVPDLLGRGVSEPRPDVPYRLRDEVARAATLASELPDRGYLVAGHSQGAALAVALAGSAERRNRVPAPAGLVLIAPVTPWTQRPRLLEALRLSPVRRAVAPLGSVARGPVTRWVLEHRAFADPSRVEASTVRRYARPWSDVRRARALLRVLADWRPAELSGHLPDAPPPTQVVAGAMDRRIRPAEARRWAGRLGAGFSLARGAGHVVPEERPDLTAAAVRRVAERAGLET